MQFARAVRRSRRRAFRRAITSLIRHPTRSALGASRRQVRLSVVLEALVMGILASIVGLFLGRMPLGFRNVGAWALRYGAETNAYFFLLTDVYPYSGPWEFAPPRPAPPPPEPTAQPPVMSAAAVPGAGVDDLAERHADAY